MQLVTKQKGINAKIKNKQQAKKTTDSTGSHSFDSEHIELKRIQATGECSWQL